MVSPVIMGRVCVIRESVLLNLNNVSYYGEMTLNHHLIPATIPTMYSVVCLDIAVRPWMDITRDVHQSKCAQTNSMYA